CGTSSKTTRISRTRLKRRSRQPWVSVSGRRKRPHRYPSTSDGGARPLRLAAEPARAAGSHRPGGTRGDARPPTRTPFQPRIRRAGIPRALRPRGGIGPGGGPETAAGPAVKRASKEPGSHEEWVERGREIALRQLNLSPRS